MNIRAATEGDLHGIVALTTAHRTRLADWSPVWWRKASTADEAHPGWLAHLVASPDYVVRAVVEGDAVVGCAVSVPQSQQWFIDDVALADDDLWSTVGIRLLQAIEERPALTCVPSADIARLTGSGQAGLRRVSSYWIGAPRDGTPVTQPLNDWLVPPAPPHTFGGTLDPRAEGALTFVDGDGDGLVVGSPPVHAPPVYDPGGTVCVIDRVVGTDRRRLLDTALALSLQRGDVLVNVVVGEDDLELADLAEDAGLQRTVDVLAWP